MCPMCQGMPIAMRAPFGALLGEGTCVSRAAPALEAWGPQMYTGTTTAWFLLCAGAGPLASRAMQLDLSSAWPSVTGWLATQPPHSDAGEAAAEARCHMVAGQQHKVMLDSTAQALRELRAVNEHDSGSELGSPRHSSLSRGPGSTVDVDFVDEALLSTGSNVLGISSCYESGMHGDAVPVEGLPSRHLWLGNLPTRPNRQAVEDAFRWVGAVTRCQHPVAPPPPASGCTSLWLRSGPRLDVRCRRCAWQSR